MFSYSSSSPFSSSSPTTPIFHIPEAQKWAFTFFSVALLVWRKSVHEKFGLAAAAAAAVSLVHRKYRELAQAGAAGEQELIIQQLRRRTAKRGRKNTRTKKSFREIDVCSQ